MFGILKYLKSKNVSNPKKQKATGPRNMGRIKNPDGTANIRGLCNDIMEMYLSVHIDKITDARFQTDGCGASQICGSIAAQLAVDKTIHEVLRLSPADVIDAWESIPHESVHCAILAINTLHKALANYLLRNQYRKTY